MVTLEALPEDIKRLICAELAKTHSVRPFWQVSRAWRDVGDAFVYRGLSWIVNSEEGSSKDAAFLTKNGMARKSSLRNQFFQPLLRTWSWASRLVNSWEPEGEDRDAGTWHRDSLASRCLRHTRHISITTDGVWYSDDEDQDEDAKYVDKRYERLRGIRPTASPFSLDKVLNPSFDEAFECDETEDLKTAEAMWSPLVATIPLFQHLTDIDIRVSGRFPPGLLAAIEQHHPKCRLHLRNFRFKSLHEPTTDSEERALAMSPNLHSMSILSLRRDSHAVDDFNGAAALSVVAHAPNLKHIVMIGCRPYSSPMLSASLGRRPYSTWQGFVPAIERSQKAKLETMHLRVYDSVLDCAKLAQWQGLVDFSHLKALKCEFVDEQTLQQISWDDTFPNLQKLDFCARPNGTANLPAFEQAVDTFFTTLNPLRSLVISAPDLASRLDVLLARHGPTLEDLSIRPLGRVRITAPVLEALAKTCPNLMSLGLMLKRSMGDQTETRCYEALGTFPRLQNLALRLNCINGDPSLSPEDDWDDFDRATQTPLNQNTKTYNGYLKRAIINSALDEHLVREIWAVINKKGPEAGTGTNSLQSLKIYTYGGSGLTSGHPSDLMEICDHISRSYRVTATPCAEGGVEVVELSKRVREEKDRKRRVYDRRFELEHGRLYQSMSYKVLRHIWPFEDGQDWRHVWRSWPLQRDTGGLGTLSDTRAAAQ